MERSTIDDFGRWTPDEPIPHDLLAECDWQDEHPEAVRDGWVSDAEARDYRVSLGAQGVR
jgi:hypothetical protein